MNHVWWKPQKEVSKRAGEAFQWSTLGNLSSSQSTLCIKRKAGVVHQDHDHNDHLQKRMPRVGWGKTRSRKAAGIQALGKHWERIVSDFHQKALGKHWELIVSSFHHKSLSIVFIRLSRPGNLGITWKIGNKIGNELSVVLIIIRLSVFSTVYLIKCTLNH